MISPAWVVGVAIVVSFGGFMMLWPFFYTLHLVAGLVNQEPITHVKRRVAASMLVASVAIAISLMVRFVFNSTVGMVSDPQGWTTWIVTIPNALVLVMQGIVCLVQGRTR